MTQEIVDTPQQPNHLQQMNEAEDSMSGESLDCRNCGALLNGPYCHHCGQSSRNMIKFIGEIFQELLDDLLGYDSRLKHTIFPLLFKPAAISLDYIKGRRSHYVLPIRLYLVTSLLFILVLQFNTDADGINFGDDEAQEVVTEIGNALDDNSPSGPVSFDISIDEESKASDSLNSDDPTNRQVDALKHQSTATENNSSATEHTSDSEIIENQGKENQVNENQNKESEVNAAEVLFKSYFEEINNKWKENKSNPGVILEKVIELLPYMMFVLLPLFALVLKLAYVFKKRYYIEHVIFLLHNHCFLYVFLMIDIGLSAIIDQLKGSSFPLADVLKTLLDWVANLFAMWVFVYIVWAMKRFYRQGWPMTILKASLLSIVYFSLLLIGFVVIAFVGTFQA